jgi:acyl carrier protein phosphodiesterase
MNWLAHLYLSEPTPEFRLGNLLPDILPAAALAAMPAQFLPGIRCHRAIDAFTDEHAIFRRSIRRIEPPFQRYGGVLIDIFYDHVLAREWDSFAGTALPEFAADVYASLETQLFHLPPETRARLDAMRRANWLCGYREIAGITETLSRIGRRFRRPVNLAATVPQLERDYALFRADFAEFFPQLIAHVSAPYPGFGEP